MQLGNSCRLGTISFACGMVVPHMVLAITDGVYRAEFWRYVVLCVVVCCSAT